MCQLLVMACDDKGAASMASGCRCYIIKMLIVIVRVWGHERCAYGTCVTG